MAWTEVQLQALQDALASSTLRVRMSDGRERVYRSVQELKDAIALVEGSIATAAGTRNRIHRAYTDKGLV